MTETKRRIVLVRHDAGPDDDRVTAWLGRNGFAADPRRPFDGETMGQLDGSVAGSVVFGGRFDAYGHDRYPFLKEEERWIGACMAQGVPLLGICLGAQQIAQVLGAKVGPSPGGWCEFGYYPIRPTQEGRAFFPDSLRVAQSHYHTFDMPAGATRLASSELFENQAFRFGEATFALQFHAEVTPQGFRRWQESSGNYGRPGAQPRSEQDALMAAHDGEQAAWFETFLGLLFGSAG